MNPAYWHPRTGIWDDDGPTTDTCLWEYPGGTECGALLPDGIVCDGHDGELATDEGWEDYQALRRMHQI